MLNHISERGLSKNYLVKIKNFTRATTNKINEEIDVLLESKPNILIVHARTKDLTKQINSLNSFKKILKKRNEISPTTELALSEIILRKGKASLIEHDNLNKKHLGIKKLHLNRKSYAAFANNILNLFFFNFFSFDQHI